jgi:hypothetical protein
MTNPPISSSGWTARIERDGVIDDWPVEQWDHDGQALIADPDRGSLRVAAATKGFQGLERAHRAIGTIAAPSGAHVTVRVHRPATAENFRKSDEEYLPLIGWMVTDRGAALPLVARPDDPYPSVIDGNDFRSMTL